MNILNNINESFLSIRCCNTLHANNIDRVIEVLTLTHDQILSLNKIAPKTVREISEFQDELLTHEGVRYRISNEFPKNDDMVLTYHYGIWRYKDHDSMLPFWTNALACVKLIE